jgi:hypothetical protein
MTRPTNQTQFWSSQIGDGITLIIKKSKSRHKLEIASVKGADQLIETMPKTSKKSTDPNRPKTHFPHFPLLP